MVRSVAHWVMMGYQPKETLVFKCVMMDLLLLVTVSLENARVMGPSWSGNEPTCERGK